MQVGKQAFREELFSSSSCIIILFSGRSKSELMAARLCRDCVSPLPYPRVSNVYCNTCYEVRKTYSQVCSSCKTGIISLESEDFVDMCEDCSTTDHKCATQDCQNMIAETWKTLCTSCYNKTRTQAPTGEPSLCTKCSSPVDASWQKLCPSCFKAEPKQRTPVRGRSLLTSTPSPAGIFRCQTPGCGGTTDQKWKTMCIPCYKTRR